MASLLDPPDPDATDSNPVSAALGDLYRKVTGYMNSKPEMAFRYADNPVGTETTQSMGMPAPTTYAPGRVGEFVNPATGELTDQGRQRMADNPLLGFDTGGVSPVSGLLGALKGYHGSPHAFDRFDNAAIGSGEGAQAYGYGHYLADSEGVARSYRDKLSTGPMDGLNNALTDFQPYNPNGPAPTMENLRTMLLAHDNPALRDAGGNDVVVRDLRTMLSGHDLNSNTWDDAAAKAASRLDTHFSNTAPAGHMYEVNVAAEPEHFLDWDKPLSEQHPVVQAALRKIEPYRLREDMSFAGFPSPRGPTGGEYLKDLAGMAPEDAAAALHKAGIPGIRYLDAGSRGKGEGSRNTVVFDPSTMDIIRRYGVAGLLGGAAAAGSRVGADGRQEQ